MTDWKHQQSRFVDQVMGAFMFIRRDVFEKIGYFDERFFVYYEELDFSLRLFRAGGKTYYNANIQAIHTGMGTTDAVKAFRLFLSLKSRLQYAKKHFSYWGFAVVWFSTCFVECITRILMLLLKGRIAECGDVVRGYQMLIKGKR
jgi:GT2 family glycosyltransferase